MGAWGASLYANDDSCDVRDYFLRTLREHPEMNEFKVFDEVKEHFADQMMYADVVLSLADLSITFTTLTPELYETAVKAIDMELEELHQWTEPEERRAFLVAFKEYLKVSVPKSNLFD